ncbi:MAG TPA: hypothetical protein VGB59_11520 [Allosphingosinicella sp.]
MIFIVFQGTHTIQRIGGGEIIMRITKSLAAFAAILMVGTPLATTAASASDQAAASKASAILTSRAGEVVEMINGRKDLTKVVAPAMLEKLPAERMAEMNAQIREQHGEAKGVSQLEEKAPNRASFQIDFEKVTLSVDMALDDQAPHLIRGLRVTNSTPK